MATADLTRINSNIAAMNTLNALRDVNKNLALHQSRLASGKRINEAADDPAGLTLATKMGNRAQYLQQAMDNIGDGKNLLSVAEGGLKKINEIVTKMRVKAEQAASDTLGTSERAAISTQLGQYAKEIDDIVNQTTWNGNKLLDGLSMYTGNQIILQTGAEANETTSLQASENFGSASVSSILSTHIADSRTATVPATGTGAFAAGGTTLTAPTVTVAGAGATALPELATGTYHVILRVNTASAAGGGVAQLLDSANNVVKIDTGGGVLGDSVAFTTAAAATINLGRGMTITTSGASTATGTATFDVAYQKAGDYAFDMSSATTASAVVTDLDNATSGISSRLQTVGALMDRLTFKEDALSISKVNTEAAFNRIMNADMADEQLQATKYQILQSTATTMLAQANTAPQSIMQLFR